MTTIAKRHVEQPLIGSYVLESLTTGMYGEPRNAIREYVQNAFDAVVAARRTGLLQSSGGRIVLTIDSDADELRIHDDGIGLPAAIAVDTLTAMGASRKERGRDAGFRGIGRLAGIAFCEKLTFKTRADGERFETNVEFDCLALRAGMLNNRHKEAAKLVAECARWWTSTPSGDSGAHYFQVTLAGLRSAPQETRQRGDLVEFLSQIAPVDFSPAFPFAADIERQLKLVTEIEGLEDMAKRIRREAVPVQVREEATGSEEWVYKPYGQLYPVGSPQRGVELTHVQIVYGAESKAWWGWVGHKKHPGAFKDANVAGIRFRVNSIQIDGNQLIRSVPVSDAKPRVEWEIRSDWFVGEIYVDPLSVVPNARRDGFEQDEKWLKIRREITSVCTKLTKEAHEISKAHKISLGRVSKKWDNLQKQCVTILRVTSPDPSRVEKLLGDIAKLQQDMTKAADGADETETKALRSMGAEIYQVKSNLIAKPQPGAERRLRDSIKEEILAKVVTILEQRLPLAQIDDVVSAVRAAVR